VNPAPAAGEEAFDARTHPGSQPGRLDLPFGSQAVFRMVDAGLISRGGPNIFTDEGSKATFVIDSQVEEAGARVSRAYLDKVGVKRKPALQKYRKTWMTCI